MSTSSNQPTATQQGTPVSSAQAYAMHPKNTALSHPLVDKAHSDLINNASRYLSQEQLTQLTHACYFGDIAHIKDTRKSGEPYITHPIAVANILANYHADIDTLVAAILHDTIEDTDVTKEEVIECFNVSVAELVDGVTKLKISKNKEQNKAATFRKILTATLADPRVIIVKVADRIHNMSTMEAVRPAKRVSTAQETIDFYLPFARVMGLNELADTLELLCFENLDSDQYKYFNDHVQQSMPSRIVRKQQFIDYFNKKIADLDLGSSKVHYNKIRVELFREFFKQKRNVEQLVNRYEFTIELENVAACNAFFDYLKKRYDIKPENIRDYIKQPYTGGYQALHIKYEHNNEYIKLVIQTNTMYKAARHGVLLGSDAPTISKHGLQATLKNLHELVDNDCAQTTIDALINYFNTDKIIAVDANTGNIHELPKGASVLDYAYDMSIEAANTAVSAHIDGVECCLATKVKNGQKISINTQDDATPQPEWLGFVVTANARQKIVQSLKQLSFEQQIQAGVDSLNRCLAEFDTSTQDLRATQWTEILEWQSLHDKQQIFQRIATGKLLPQLVVTKLFSQKAVNNPISTMHKTSQSTVIKGTRGIELHYSTCCNPILGDNIVGVFNQHGLEVHRHRCYDLSHQQNLEPQNILSLAWNESNLTTIDSESPSNPQNPLFGVILCIDMACNDDVISQIILKLHEINAAVNSVHSDGNQTIADIRVSNRSHVSQVMRELRSVLDFPGVKRWYRPNQK